MASSTVRSIPPRIYRHELWSELRWRRGPVDRAMADAFYDSGNLRIGPGGFVLEPAPGLALRYRRGEGLVYDLSEGGEATRADVELWAEGFARGLVAWLNGFAVLHASAVARGSRALALAGASGAGKSTTAAALTARGFSLIEDDGLIVEDTGTGLLALAGRPRVKLWSAAVDLARPAGAGDALIHQPGKFAFAMPDAGSTGVYALRHVLVLDPRLGDSAIRPVLGKDKLTLLRQNLFRDYLVADLIGPSAAAATLLRLAQGLTVWECGRPERADRLDGFLDGIEAWFERGAGAQG